MRLFFIVSIKEYSFCRSSHEERNDCTHVQNDFQKRKRNNVCFIKKQMIAIKTPLYSQRKQKEKSTSKSPNLRFNKRVKTQKVRERGCKKSERRKTKKEKE